MGMYKNIQTLPALNQIAQYYNGSKKKYQNPPVTATIRALCLMMKNNVFRFGDSHWLQPKRTATGTPPVPTYATVFYGVFELSIL